MTKEDAKKEFCGLWNDVKKIEEFQNTHDMSTANPWGWAIGDVEEVIWCRMMEIMDEYPELTEELFGVRYYIKNGYIVKENEHDTGKRRQHE